MNARITERDVRLLAKLGVCRWLTTTQVKCLYFPEATLNAVQKRLRKLSDAGYVRSHREHLTAEAMHAVGPKGKPLVEERGIGVTLSHEVPAQLEHLVGVNDLRVAVEASGMDVAWFFGYWELSDLGWTHPVIPDAVFAVRVPERRSFVLEYDRSTETIEKLAHKLRSYDRGLPGFPFEAVVIVAERTRQLDLLSREMRRDGLTVVLLASTAAEVAEAGIFACEFTELPGGKRRKLLASPREDLEI
jgi:hypothetical protein